MKIIKKGIPPKERLWIGTCTHCGSIFEAKQGEIEVSYDRGEQYASAKCEICSNQFYLYPKKESTSSYEDR